MAPFDKSDLSSKKNYLVPQFFLKYSSSQTVDFQTYFEKILSADFAISLRCRGTYNLHRGPCGDVTSVGYALWTRPICIVKLRFKLEIVFVLLPPLSNDTS
jgi:hypothetical protein